MMLLMVQILATLSFLIQRLCSEKVGLKPEVTGIWASWGAKDAESYKFLLFRAPVPLSSKVKSLIRLKNQEMSRGKKIAFRIVCGEQLKAWFISFGSDAQPFLR